MFCFGRILISFTELLNFDSVCEKNRRKIYEGADRAYQNCKLFQMLKKNPTFRLEKDLLWFTRAGVALVWSLNAPGGEVRAAREDGGSGEPG